MSHKNKILQLRLEGKSYKEIQLILGCSKGTISFHCGKNQKQKSMERQRKNRKLSHPYKKKIESFLNNTKNKKSRKNSKSINELILLKIKGFHKKYKLMEYEKMSFTFDDVLQKFTEKPKCYLTGQTIDIYKPRDYHFDHIIPRSRGGQNSLDNLGITTKQVNEAKGNMTPDEFINLCKTVLLHQGYKISKD